MPETGAAGRRWWGIATLSGIAALLSATGRVEPEAMAVLQGQGLSEGSARLALHLAPVALTAGVLGAAVWIARGRGTVTRYGIYAIAGLIVGYVSAYCLEVLAGLEPMLAALAGGLAPPTKLDALAWVFAGFCLVLGAAMLAYALFGGGAVRALQFDTSVDEEALDVRRAERRDSAWAGFGLVGHGVAIGGLALLSQGADPTPGAIAAIAGALVFVGASAVLWRVYDELMRRVVVNAYAAAAIAFTAVLFAWAILELQGAAPAMDAYGAVLAFLAIQTAAALVCSVLVLGAEKAQRAP